MQQYLSDAQLAERYHVSRSTIWRWTNRDLLPKPVQLSPGTTRWRKDEIERHEATKQQSAA
ncbi:AlpA family phage regulatory protein [Steroidobacter sp. S1-65]|uniref:AlpA family phage regulatory protein n=1 Tax=Steroidobacter gossypii TaxID=2805490 RepID=A0ABS1WW73_9GAMM|nr:AlpA family phage regulatory protein [Steroidobacter gossypii]